MKTGTHRRDTAYQLTGGAGWAEVGGNGDAIEGPACTISSRCRNAVRTSAREPVIVATSSTIINHTSGTAYQRLRMSFISAPVQKTGFFASGGLNRLDCARSVPRGCCL